MSNNPQIAHAGDNNTASPGFAFLAHSSTASLSDSVNIGANKEEIELIQDIQNLPDEKIIEMIESKSQII